MPNDASSRSKNIFTDQEQEQEQEQREEQLEDELRKRKKKRDFGMESAVAESGRNLKRKSGSTMTTTTSICSTDDDNVVVEGKNGLGINGKGQVRGEGMREGIRESTVRREIKNKQSWDYIWRTGLAGGLAGSAAKTVVAPLDRVKILFQASNPQFAKYTGSWFGYITAMRDIHTDEGIRGLFRGHSATILRIFPYAAIKFLAYEQIRAVIIPKHDYETPFRRLISGSLAGVTSVFFTYPLEVMRVRLAFETKKDGVGLGGICRRIYHEVPSAPRTATAAVGGGVIAGAENTVQALIPKSGLANFYRGFSATILGMLPYAGMSFLTHDTAGDLLRHPKVSQYTTLPKPAHYAEHKPAPLRSWAELFAGGVAGLVSQSSAYPLEVIRRRMQVGGTVGDGRRLRIGETASMIVRERGWRGFFVGLTIGYVKVVPMVAVSFYVYERGKGWLGI
ncbi:mitochondrial carrier protein LEU5 [Sclerotinia borealis F-4128]|uniref:Mitochondrial thiamine pyrophosphate carrier 1 n=1 Tax=Sclerotinia borealis (strain F-4128) TaxID=1432307 RepID=W9CAI0_SCLBF|nr:mitochondrial carrier protein LEU5 [Sclerotinia borealis F-4128]